MSPSPHASDFRRSFHAQDFDEGLDALKNLVTIYDNGCDDPPQAPLLPIVLGFFIVLLLLRILYTVFRRICGNEDPKTYNTDSVDVRLSMVAVHVWGGAVWPPHHYCGPAHIMLLFAHVAVLLVATTVGPRSTDSASEDHDVPQLAAVGVVAAVVATVVHALLRLPFMASTVVHHEHRCRAYQIVGFVLSTVVIVLCSVGASYLSMDFCKAAFIDWCLCLALAAVASLIVAQVFLCIAVYVWRSSWAKARYTAARRPLDPDATCCCFCDCCVGLCGPSGDVQTSAASDDRVAPVSMSDFDLTARRQRITVRNSTIGLAPLPFVLFHPVMHIHRGTAQGPADSGGGAGCGGGSASPPGAAADPSRPAQRGASRLSVPPESSAPPTPRPRPPRFVGSSQSLKSPSHRQSSSGQPPPGYRGGGGGVGNPLQHRRMSMSMESAVSEPSVFNDSATNVSTVVVTPVYQPVGRSNGSFQQGYPSGGSGGGGGGQANGNLPLYGEDNEMLSASANGGWPEPASEPALRIEEDCESHNNTLTSMGNTRRRGTSVVFVGESADNRRVAPHYANEAEVIRDPARQGRDGGAAPPAPAPPRRRGSYDRDRYYPQ